MSHGFVAMLHCCGVSHTQGRPESNSDQPLNNDKHMKPQKARGSITHAILPMLILLLTLLHATPSIAQSPDTKAPHGGVLQKADGNRYVEMVVSGNTLLFYLLDKDLKPLSSAGVTGNAEFQFVDGTVEKTGMEAQPEGTFQAVVKSPADFTAVTTFKINGKVVTASIPSGTRVKRQITHPHRHNPDGSHAH